MDKSTHTPSIGFVSLGCPKALTDSERIMSRLRAEGYMLVSDYAGADAVIVNTCGFLDSARSESLDAIGEALRENGTVIVTGCLGAEPELIRARHPGVTAVTGPHRYEEVMTAVRSAVPPPQRAHEALIPEPLIKLTPRHYAYLKIAEGCNNRCSFCIIPGLRGRLVSRPINEVLREAERLVQAGVKEILIVSQDTGAYGLDCNYAEYAVNGRAVPTRIDELARELGRLGVWIRLHYVYPYPHIDRLLPLMAEGAVLPYLDMPLQHLSPPVLKAMRRPAAAEKTIDRLSAMRAAVPDLTIRSTFIVGFPGETEEDFELLLQGLQAVKLDRVGCFKYEAVQGAAANELPGAVPEEVKQERYDRLMRAQAVISAEQMQAKVGTRQQVIIDEVARNGRAKGRTRADAPEIDGTISLSPRTGNPYKVGEIITAEVTYADIYDLKGRFI